MDDDRLPDTLAELLRDLGVTDRGEDEQIAAVRACWDDHPVHRVLWRDVAAQGGRWFKMANNGRSMNAPMHPRFHPAPTPQERTATRRHMEAEHSGRFRQLREAERRHYIEAGLTPPDDLNN